MEIKSICQDDCDFSFYNYTSKIVNCSCDAKEMSLSFALMNINKTKLVKNFVDIKNIVNFNMLICYKNLFNKNGILLNKFP